MNHAPVTLNIVRRFLARDMLADDRFQPPLPLVNAVDTGVLDTKCLLLWKVCADNLLSGLHGKPPANRQDFFRACTEYFRNKCAKENVALPKEFATKGMFGGPGSEGKWSRRPGDQVEDWVKQRLLSEGLISSLGKSAAEWEIDIRSLTDYVKDAQSKIDKHTEGMAHAKSPAGVAQRKKWLEGAMRDFDEFSKQRAKAEAGLKAVVEAANKGRDVENYSIEFEKEFQFMMNQALRELDKKHILDSVKKAMERFENGLAMPEANWGPEGAPKTAGLLDEVGAVLTKAWNHLKGAFEMFIDWAAGLDKDAKDIEDLIKSA